MFFITEASKIQNVEYTIEINMTLLELRNLATVYPSSGST